jgi:ESCRT-I complex subunit VPS28
VSCSSRLPRCARAQVTESLETAYSRDAVSSQDYATACARLITQFKSTESALITAGIISSAEVFIREFNVDCPRAYDRLLKFGVPATVLHDGGRAGDGQGQREPDSVIVAETVQAFITAIDALALENYAVDVVQPLASDLMGALTRVSSLPPDFEALVKLRLWLQKLNELRAYEELKEEEARQLKFDLESSYQAFMKHLSAPRS